MGIWVRPLAGRASRRWWKRTAWVLACGLGCFSVVANVASALPFSAVRATKVYDGPHAVRARVFVGVLPASLCARGGGSGWDVGKKEEADEEDRDRKKRGSPTLRVNLGDNKTRCRKETSGIAAAAEEEERTTTTKKGRRTGGEGKRERRQGKSKAVVVFAPCGPRLSLSPPLFSPLGTRRLSKGKGKKEKPRKHDKTSLFARFFRSFAIALRGSCDSASLLGPLNPELVCTHIRIAACSPKMSCASWLAG